MQDRIRLPEGNFDETSPAPCWVAIFKEDDCGNKVHAKPVIRCRCGEYTGINLHSVSASGEVNNSFYHTNGSPCGWHVFLFLEGYQEKIGIAFQGEK